jgi:hypothetical protein
MYRIIGADGNEYGPETTEQVRQWIAEGRANGQTLVRPEESNKWGRLASFAEFTEALAAAPTPSGTPARPAVTGAGTFSEAQILAGAQDFSIGDCLSRGMALLGENFGLLAGATLVIGSLDFATRLIPFAHAFLSGVFFGGLYLVYLARIRGQPASANEAFSGFGPSFVQLVLVGFLTAFLTFLGYICCTVPGIFLHVAWIFSVALAADKRLEFWTAMQLSLKVVSRHWFKVLGLLLVAFSPFLLFSLFVYWKTAILMYSIFTPLMTGNGATLQKFVEAAMQVGAATWTLNLIAQVILVVNLPFGLAALMYAYEALFGTRAPAAS